MNVKLIPASEVEVGMYIDDRDGCGWWPISEVSAPCTGWCEVRYSGGYNGQKPQEQDYPLNAHVLVGIPQE